VARLAIHFLYALLLAAPWYIISQVQIARGLNAPEFPYIEEAMGSGRTLLQRLLDGMTKLGKYNALFAISLVCLPILNKAYRWLFLLVILPFTVMWGFLYSYDVRNLSVVFPVVALTAGMGLEAILRHSERLFILLRISRVRVYALLALLAASIVLVSLRFPDNSLISRQISLQRQLWYPQLNEILYAQLADLGPETQIVTNYRADFLPGMEHSVLLYDFLELTDLVSLLENHPEAELILYPGNADGQILAFIDESIGSGQFQLVVDMGYWKLVRR
jgi:hypothetical protein